MMKPLQGRTAIITGASQGLGRSIAHRYLEAGASIVICARTAGRLREAETILQAACGPGQILVARQADIASEDDTKMLVDTALERLGHVDILVNNAATLGPVGPTAEVEWTAWLDTIRVDLTGPAYLMKILLPHLCRTDRGKIIALSGGGATKPFPRLTAYAAAKAGLVRFCESLAEELRDAHVDVNCIAPGALNTSMQDAVLAAGPERAGQKYYETIARVRETGGTPLEPAANLAVFLGSRASDGITGRLISAVWDPWESLPDHREGLQDSDVYTLRRIVPRDRGLTWGDR